MMALRTDTSDGGSSRRLQTHHVGLQTRQQVSQRLHARSLWTVVLQRAASLGSLCMWSSFDLRFLTGFTPTYVVVSRLRLRAHSDGRVNVHGRTSFHGIEGHVMFTSFPAVKPFPAEHLLKLLSLGDGLYCHAQRYCFVIVCPGYCSVLTLHHGDCFCDKLSA